MSCETGSDIKRKAFVSHFLVDQYEPQCLYNGQVHVSRPKFNSIVLQRERDAESLNHPVPVNPMILSFSQTK